MRLTAVLLVGVLSWSCTSNKEALRASRNNVTNIRDVQIGQSMLEVLSTMKHDPEIRNVRVSDANRIEEWAYVVDYENDRQTTITFTNNRVTEIRQERWDGTWSRDTIRVDEDLATPEERSRLDDRQRNLGQLIDQIKPGTTRTEVMRILGVPHKNMITYRGNQPMELMEYASGDRRWKVQLENNKVTSITPE